VSPALPYSPAGLMLFAIEFSGSLPRSRARVVSFAPSFNLSAKVDALTDIGFTKFGNAKIFQPSSRMQGTTWE
jgi:hypothetical protein